jgi:hypothetical protein
MRPGRRARRVALITTKSWPAASLVGRGSLDVSGIPSWEELAGDLAGPA